MPESITSYNYPTIPIPDLEFAGSNDFTQVMPAVKLPTINRLALDSGEMHEHSTSVFANVRHDLQPSLDAYLGGCAAYIYGTGLEPASKQDMSWSDWLAKVANTSELQAFANAHKYELETRAADPKLTEVIAERQNTYLAHISPWVASGRFSPSILDRVSRLQRAKAKLGDIWDTVLLDRPAYRPIDEYNFVIGQGDPEIYIGGKAQTEIDVAWEAVLHELDHVVNDRVLPSFIREALAEHISLTMQQGSGKDQYQILDPDARNDDSGVYTGYRKLLHVMANEGDEPVPIQVWTRAHSSAGQESSEYQYLLDRFDRAWDTGFEQVATTLVTHTAQIAEAKPELSMNTVHTEAVQATILELHKHRQSRDEVRQYSRGRHSK